MYRDFARAIRDGRPPEMSLERATDDQRLMDQIYGSLQPPVHDAPTGGAAPWR
jgi:predicted dehydrogenase